MTLKYSDLTPEMLTVLRLDAALEAAYGDTKSRAILEGHKAWRMKVQGTPQVLKHSRDEQGNMASRDRSQTSRGVS